MKSTMIRVRRHMGQLLARFSRQLEEPGPTVETAAEIDSDMPVARLLAEAIEMATSLMREHGLKGWRVKLTMPAGGLGNAITPIG